MNLDKTAYWFSHDYNAGQDPKLIKLQMSMGHEGKGIFWDLVELIYSEGGKLVMAECETYAFVLRTDATKLRRVITDFDLFKNDGEFFWSESINKRLELRNEKSAKASQSAKDRWGNANAMQTHSERNAIKEKKGKDNKGKDIKERKNTAEFDSFWVIYAKPTGEEDCRDAFSDLTPSEISHIFDTLPSYIAATPDIKFRKNPLTYLNGKCWNDTPITPQTPKREMVY